MGEWTVILLIGVMVYGRRLPEVGRQLGRTVAKFRRGFDEFRRELDRDDSMREMRSGMRDMRNALDAPRRALDPRRYLEDAIYEGGRAEPPSSWTGRDHEHDVEEPAVRDPNAPAEPSEEASRAAEPPTGDTPSGDSKQDS